MDSLRILSRQVTRACHRDLRRMAPRYTASHITATAPRATGTIAGSDGIGCADVCQTLRGRAGLERRSLRSGQTLTEAIPPKHG
jgi:hypothetical protein